MIYYIGLAVVALIVIELLLQTAGLGILALDRLADWWRWFVAELKRDDQKEIARAKELYLRSVDEHRWGGAIRYADSPENSPEASAGEDPKSK